MGRHTVSQHHPPIGRILLEFAGGLLLCLSLLTGYQTLWPYYGAGLDADTTAHTFEDAHTTTTRTVTPGRTVHWRNTTPPIDSTPATGSVYGRLYIPRLGADWSKPILQGVGERQLAVFGVGHYPDTVMPGAVGNTSYAGHRAPADLGYMDRLQVGDMVYVKGPSAWYRYRLVRAPYIVHMSHTEVIAPTAAGTARGLTLTTCEPMFSPTPARDRLIAHAAFAGWAPVSEGVPAEYAKPVSGVSRHVTRMVRSVSETSHVPVTGVVAAGLGVAWLALEAMCWLLWHRRMAGMLRNRPSWSPAVWLWRLQAGPVADHGVLRWVGRLVRLVGLMLLLTALMFAEWRWLGSWMSDHVALFSTGTPSVG